MTDSSTPEMDGGEASETGEKFALVRYLVHLVTASGWTVLIDVRVFAYKWREGRLKEIVESFTGKSSFNVTERYNGLAISRRAHASNGGSFVTSGKALFNEAFPVIDVTPGGPIHLLDITPTNNAGNELSSDRNGIRTLAGVFQKSGLGPTSISRGSMDRDAFRACRDTQTSRSLTKLGNDLPIRSLLCRFRCLVVQFDLNLQTTKSSIVFNRAESTKTLYSSAPYNLRTSLLASR